MTTAIDATTSNETISGSRNNDNPKPTEPTNNPIAIPTIGKRYMNLAIVSRFALLVGIIVRNENTEPICLSKYTQPQIRQNSDYWNRNYSKEKNCCDFH